MIFILIYIKIYTSNKNLFTMRDEIIKLIKILGIGYTELILTFDLDCGNFESIEYIEEDDLILLHIFQDEDFDITFDFDEIEEDDQKRIYYTLSVIYN